MFKPKRKLERNPAAGGDNDEPIPEVAGGYSNPKAEVRSRSFLHSA
jgi:hypothetical protein